MSPLHWERSAEGWCVGESRFGHQAAADLAPFRDAFSALFFVSVGMLFDPALLQYQPRDCCSLHWVSNPL